MNLRHYGNKARQSYWLIHIDAWRRSGVTRTEYCRKHRLTKGTFDRWLEYLLGADAARKHAEYQAELRREKRLAEREKRRRNGVRRHYAVSTDTRNRALQAFWAMHVEAMNWSGMSIGDYAGSLHLSPHTLHGWCLLLESGEVEIDWRAHLHPSARPVVSTSANATTPEIGLAVAVKSEPPPNHAGFGDSEKPYRHAHGALLPPARIANKLSERGAMAAMLCASSATALSFERRSTSGPTTAD